MALAETAVQSEVRIPRGDRSRERGSGAVHRVSDLELASRLSFFLWSSIPDDELLEPRRPGKAEESCRARTAGPAHADGSKSSTAIVQNFAGQWLYLRNLKNQIPNSLEFPDFDDNLRQALQRETELFFQQHHEEDRNVLDLMTADYTFVNERLAKHYGMPNIYGSHFRRVAVTDEARKGLLGKGSILMVTSHTDRTSPVVRGKWILENLLGAPLPPPPANGAAFERERGTSGWKNPVHAGAHGGTSQGSGLLGLPQHHGPDRVCDGELRCGRSLAHT